MVMTSGLQKHEHHISFIVPHNLSLFISLIYYSFHVSVIFMLNEYNRMKSYHYVQIFSNFAAIIKQFTEQQK